MSTFSRSYQFDGRPVELELSSAVFQPTLTSKILAEAMDITSETRALDLGCGSGILAIVAALKGARCVDAVDVMPQACDLAIANAQRNGVSDRVQVACGDLYEPIGDERYDVIISDVSGVVDEVARLSPWYPPSIPTGGKDGADHVVRLIYAAVDHLRPNGTLFFATGSISNVKRTLQAAHDAFGDKVALCKEVSVPFCTEFNDNIKAMTRMQQEGLVDFTVKRSRRLWTLQVYRAWL